MGKKRKELSEAEIWDDSALINSWNESYEEYKMYHSLHSKGVNIQEYLKQQEQTEDELVATNVADANSKDDLITDGEAPGNDTIESEEATAMLDGQQAATAPGNKADALPVLGPTARMPQFLTEGSTQSDGLKNLMMSWYWAGYYTGLHEGRQQAQPGSDSQMAAGSAG